MPDLTPIRIRGKRGAAKEEKWHARKQRKRPRQGSTSISDQSSSARSTPSLVKAAARRNRARADTTLSRLEQLPTEMLQSIFECSGNIDLPLASPRLGAQLGSGVLYHQLTSQILHEVVGPSECAATKSSVTIAMRLMNSKFFTLSFFQQWLDSEFERLALLHEFRAEVDEADASNSLLSYGWTWRRLWAAVNIPPPIKLLKRPFTEDKVGFLNILSTSFRDHPETLDFVYNELVQEGLQQAVEDGANNAFEAFFALGAQINTELLRKAVIDSGCDKDVVHKLISRTTSNDTPADVDFLDPALWAWADKAKAKDDEKGLWLIEQLRSAARDVGQDRGSLEAK